ncbi:MAG: hypothetical protein LBT84_06725 [Spirochaetia bacterium]|nr:hypothetical protein [Spirochaetia bacterium]
MGNKTVYMYILKTVVNLNAWFTAVSIYFIGKHLYNRRIGIFAAFFFAGYSVCMNAPGEVLPGNTEYFSSGFAAAAMALICRPGGMFRWISIFSSGILCAFATTVNTRTGIFLVVLFLWLFLNRKSWKGLAKETMILFTGFLLPYLALVLYFVLQNAIEHFLFWQGDIVKFYINRYPVFIRIIRGIKGYLFFSGLIPLLFFCVLYIKQGIKEKPRDRRFLFIAGTFILAYLSVYSSWKHMERYYFTLFIPLCLMAAAALDELTVQIKNVRPRHLAVTLTAFIAVALATPPLLYFHKNFRSAIDRKKSSIESIKAEETANKPAADYIKANTSDKEAIFVWPTGDLVYFYADRILSPSFYDPEQRLLHVAYIPNKEAADRIWSFFFDTFAASPPALILDYTDGFTHDRGKYPSSQYIDEYVDKLKALVAREYEQRAEIGNITFYHRRK